MQALQQLKAMYLFVNSAELSVLVEQQKFLLVTGGDRHTLCDQSELLLGGQQPVSHGRHILRPTHTQIDREFVL